MEEYYYLNSSNQQEGPIYPTQFAQNGVTAETLVWRNGMAGWEKAGVLPELTSYLQAATPPVPPTTAPIAPVGNTYTQTTSYTTPPTEAKPDSFLVWSILSTVLCCVPLGIVAIIYSSKVDSSWAKGDVAGAKDSAEKAKTFCFLSLAGGILAGVLMFIMALIGEL